jgi:hypothetical protein
MQSLTELKAVENPCPYLSQLQPWNKQGTFVDYLANHYALLAKNPATIEHARHQAKLLKSDFPTLGILIVKRLKELRND